MTDTIQLPRKTKEGKPRISYSQYTGWKELKSFNLGVDGFSEYMARYFFGYNFGDKGWAEFGNDVEDYICSRGSSDKFNDKEKLVMEQVETLGVFQDSFEIDFGDFVFFGIIDDRLDDWSIIRDYKTASKSSSEKYKQDDYVQLDFYAMKSIEINGEIPKMEVCVIERKGNCMFMGGREVLTVGDNIWYYSRATNMDRIESLKDDLFKVVKDISDHYKLYLKINN